MIESSKRLKGHEEFQVETSSNVGVDSLKWLQVINKDILIKL